MYRLEYDIVGRCGGNFRHGRVEERRFLFDLEREMKKRGIAKIYAPRCAFTTKIIQMGRDDEEITPWFVRTRGSADGGFVLQAGVAVAIFNADCPVVILFDKVQGYLAMLHAGFRCVVPADKNAPSIVRAAFMGNYLMPLSVKAFVGFGIGACCYGAEHVPEIERREMKSFLATATHGPRIGQRSVHLTRFIRAELRDIGVSEGAIVTREDCTACVGRNGAGSPGDYHSNVYEGEGAGRNVVLAWFRSES